MREDEHSTRRVARARTIFSEVGQLEGISHLERALILASRLHEGQVRKGTGVPYLSHLIRVASLVAEGGGDEECQIGALLHDSVEDQGASLVEIDSMFGTRVAEIVKGCSDVTDSSGRGANTSAERKRVYIDHLRNERSEDVLRVALADKIDNATDILRDYQLLGEELWSRFNVSKDEQLAYYRDLVDVFMAWAPNDPQVNRLRHQVGLIVENSYPDDIPAEALVHQAIAALSDQGAAESAETFPSRGQPVDQPGLYSWWADSEARTTIGRALGADLPPMIYAGQAGAGTSADLRQRISATHIGGRIGRSTFRLTLAAVLKESLGLELVGTKELDPHSESQLSAWIKEHLSVAVFAYPDRNTLRGIEGHVLRELDPPLNLSKMTDSPVRSRLSELRGRLREP